MEKVDIYSLEAGQDFPHYLGFDEQTLLFPPSVKISEKMLDSLKNWKVDSLYKVHKEELYSAKGDDPLFLLVSEKKFCQCFIDRSLKSLERFYEEVQRRGKASMKEIDNMARECLALVRQDKFFLTLIMHLYLPRRSVFEVDTLKVAVYSLEIGRRLGIKEDQLFKLFQSALLINIGALHMRELMEKPDKLTLKELEQIKLHPLIGFKIVKEKMKLEDTIAMVVLTHHEKIDGSGYPRNLIGKQIPLYSKIIALAEAYISLSVNKSYRRLYNLSEAINILIKENKHQFEQGVLAAFISYLSMYPVGSIVKLNTGQLAVVYSSNAKIPMRPRLILIEEADGTEIKENRSLDMGEKKDIFVKEIINDESKIKKVFDAI